MMKKKMLAVAVCVSMCMMAFAGCTSESGGGSDTHAMPKTWESTFAGHATCCLSPPEY